MLVVLAPLTSANESVAGADTVSDLVPTQHERTILARFHALRALFDRALVRRLVSCLILFGVSSALILPNLGYPRAIIFDETYYITHAQKYLNGIFFLESHPPLGKLLIAAGERWLHPDAPADEFVNVQKIDRSWPADLDITGYRLMSAFFGILNPVLVFMILTLMLGKELYALAIALFVALDNALIVQSRAGMLDSFLIFFCLASFLVFVFLARKPVPRLGPFLFLTALWGILQACAANVKLSGTVVLVLVVAYAVQLLQLHQTRRFILLGVVFILFFAITYLGLWQVHFAVARQVNPGNDYGITDAHWNILIGADHSDPLTRFVIQFKDALAYHLNGSFNVGKLDLANPNEIGSPWYWWLVGGRAIDYRWETLDGGAHYQYVYLLGNPVTWLVSLLGVLVGTALVLSDLLFRFLRSERRRWLYMLVLLYWAYMIPMALATRVTYLYHYLLPLILGVMLFGIVLWQATLLSTEVKRNILIGGLALLMLAFWVYKPLTYSEPLTRQQFQQLNIFPLWYLRCVGC